jgi:predicted metal-binding protein
MAFLVSAAKRQRSEVKFSTLNTEERRLFTEAKNKEVESWLNTETVVKILRHQIPKENILRCRWILTWKAPEEAAESTSKSQSNQKRAKARLVVLGFEDPLVDQIPRDSPTMSKLSRVLILQHAASLGWDIHSFGIKTAFLRGTEQNTRTLGMEPPEEMRTKMQLKPNEIVQLLKGAYGRVDAPFLWFQELKQSLESLGFESAPFDPCCFVLRDKNHQPEGILGIHVDDGLCCGSARFHAKIAELERKYPFGSKKNREFTFTGLKISQKNDHSIWVNQEQYVRDISPIQISRERKQSPTAPVTEAERQSLRALVGSLQYAAVNTRPDVAARLGWLQTQINKATISTLLEGNKILHETKLHSDVTIKFQAIPIDDIRFVAFSDASFSSAKNPDSHQGMMIMSTHKSIAENKNCPVNPLLWHSKKVQKVVVSTLSAEAMSLAGAVDVLSWIRLYWAWIRDGRCQWQQADETLMRLPPAFAAIPPEEDSSETKPPITLQHALSKLPDKTQAIITTDCKSLFDLISRHAPPSCQEFRTQLQAKLIKEHLRNGIQIRWVPSQAQLADALTKIMDASILRECLARGRYSLHDEDQILRARSDSRARMQWLRNMSQDSKGV